MRTITLTCLLLWLCHGARAANATHGDWSERLQSICSKALPSNTIELVTLSQYHLNHSATIEEITRIDAKSGSIHTAGFTEAKLVLGLETEFNAIEVEPLVFCGKLDFKGVVELQDFTVRIAREYKSGTCLYDRIFRHEMMHVAVNVQNAETVKQQLDKYLNQHFKDKVFFSRNQPSVDMKTAFAHISVHGEKVWNELSLRQRDIDRRDRWEEIVKSCRAANR